jgi:steroid 5-alpha reductase family enzyme
MGRMTRASMLLIFLLVSLLTTPTAASKFPSAFVIDPRRRLKISTSHQVHPPSITSLRNIRGGGGNNLSLMMTSLSSAVSPTAVAAATAFTQTISTGTPLQAMAALYAVSAATVVPLTWWRTGYSFSVGYGLSVAMMSLALLTTFTSTSNMNIASLSKLVFTSPAHFASVIALLYGLRLGAFIYIREQNVDEKKRQFAALDKTSPIKRTPLALGVSLLYAFMVSPVMFALRAAMTTATGITSSRVMMQMVFAYMAAFGMVLESVADQHKYIVKRNNANNDDENKKFVGPTTWSYTLCRHPNYLGEILHWIGLFGTGCVTFPFNRTAVTPWICGILGLWGILSIMFGASSRLDKKQTEKYAGQVNYEEWKKRVKWSIVPFIK